MRKPKLSVIQQRHPGTTLLGLFTLLALGLYLLALSALSIHDVAQNELPLKDNKIFTAETDNLLLTAGLEQPGRY